MGVEGQVSVEPDDDELDLGAGLDEPDEPVAPPPAPPVEPTEPTREQLLEMVGKLQAAAKRNNGELAKRRLLGNWMKQHGIDDLDSWLQRMGIDRETGQPVVPPPAAPAAVEPELEEEPEFEEEPEEEELDEEPEPVEERTSVLVHALRMTAVEAALKEARFSGTLERALKVMEADGSLASVEVDEGTGKVGGAAEAVQALRQEFPEWFRRQGSTPPVPPTVPPRRRPGVDAGDRRAAPPRSRGWDQQVSDRMTGRR